MKLRIVSVLLAPFCLLAVNAQALDFEGSASLGVFDKYLWRGFDLSDSTEVTQGTAELSTSGFTLGVWANAQLQEDSGWEEGEINEVDLTLDYTFDAGDLLSVNVGNITYILKNANDTNEAYVGLTLKTLLEPTLTAYWDWDSAKMNGLYYTAAVSHSIEVCPRTAVNLGALVSFHDKSDYSIGDYSDWHNYEFSAAANVKLTEQLTLTPSLLYSAPISTDAKRNIDSEWLAGVNLSYSFGF